MELPRGGHPKPNTTPCTPRRANTKCANCQTIPRSVIINLHPTHTNYSVPPMAAHTHLNAYASNKVIQGHLRGYPSLVYCAINPLPPLHYCTSTNPIDSQYHCSSHLILFGNSKPCHAKQGSWLQIPQGINLSIHLLGAPGAGRRHQATPKLPPTPQPPQTCSNLEWIFSNEM